MPAKKGGNGKKTAKQTGKSVELRQPKRREIGAVVCMFLAVFSFLGYFSADGWFIGFFRKFISGLVGRGFYIFPPILLLCAYILFFHRGRPVRMRVTCALLITLVMGAMLQLLGCSAEYKWGMDLFGKLYTAGSAAGGACSGGILGGILAMAFNAAFGKVGSTIVFVIALIFFILTAFNITLPAIVDWCKNREKAEYEYVPKPEKAGREKGTKDVGEELKNNGIAMRRGEKAGYDWKTPPKTSIDIPIDEPQKVPEEKPSFFNKKPSVPTPDKVLRAGKNSEESVAEENRSETVKVPADAQQDARTNNENEKLKAENSSGADISEHLAANTPPEVLKPLEQEMAEKKAEKARENAEKKAASAEVAAKLSENLENAEQASYVFPPTELLSRPKNNFSADGKAEVEINAQRLESTIQSFGISAKLCNVMRGPSVTRYEVELEQGVKLARLTNLSDDIALALGATGVRIAPIPNKISIVGIEVPNKIVNVVALREIIESREFIGKNSKLAFAVGKDIAGNPVVGDIAKLPHLLIAGTTGSGKSVCMNSLILSILYKASPDEVRLIMIDPKMVELGVYNEIPHLLIPVVTDPKKAAGALQWAVVEMMKRYKLFADIGARDIVTYNNIIKKTEGGQKMPRVVVLIDELADLMTVAAKEVEESICRVAQMGRASGIHLVIATQRPSADVITGLMKANIPSRIAFAVQDAINSRIILDTTGAEKLVGKGDMLYFPLGAGKPLRVQGTFVTDEEREDIVNFVKERSTSQYSDNVLKEIEKNAAKDNKDTKKESDSSENSQDDEVDELFNAAVDVILDSNQASVSMLQRRLKLGYSRAARLVDQMEERGIVGPFEGSKPRQLLITREKWKEMQGVPTEEYLPEPDDFSKPDNVPDDEDE